MREGGFCVAFFMGALVFGIAFGIALDKGIKSSINLVFNIWVGV